MSELILHFKFFSKLLNSLTVKLLNLFRKVIDLEIDKLPNYQTSFQEVRVMWKDHRPFL
jgi:hypothetical protein